MEIPYGKVAIYVLTFLGYAYSGYGQGVLTNLRDAVLSAESVFGDVFKNVIKVANSFKNVNDFFDAAVVEDCVFKCPNGVVARANYNHKPSSNGCGSLGVKIESQHLPIAEMTKCCDSHDICYDTCNNDKELCDVEFKRCLYKYCESNEKKIGSAMTRTCKGAAKMLFTGTVALGCKSYIDAQTTACYCAVKKDKKSRYTKGEGEL